MMTPKKYNQNPAALKRQPCDRDCPERCAGCQITCEKWAAYLAKREKDYERRKVRALTKNALHAGYARLAELQRK